MSTSQALKTGTILKSEHHSYRIEAVLGEGGFGITYKTVVKENRQVLLFAVKEFFPNKLCDRKGNALVCSNASKKDVASSKNDFLHEAKRLQRLNGMCDNIVIVSDVFEQNDTMYYAMEYLDGNNLRDKVCRQGALEESEMLRWIRPIASAVQFLHDNKMLHLDLKPDNVVMRMEEDGTETPVLVDFGVSMHFNKEGKPTTSSRFVGGTKGYAPLEQSQGISTFQPQVDVYALGGVMYYLLTGKDPEKATFQTAKNVRQLLPATVSARTREAVVHAMQPNPDDRPQSAASLLQELGLISLLYKTKTEPKQPATKNPEKPQSQGVKTIPLDEKHKKSESSSIQESTHIENDDTLGWIGIMIGMIITVGGASTFMVLLHDQISEWLLSGGFFTIILIGSLITLALFFLFDKQKKIPNIEMVYVSGGTFTMGGTSEQGSDACDDETAHSVTLSSFYIGKYEVTQAQWKAVMGSNPSCHKGDDLPVEQVSWNDVQEFILKLNNLTGKTYRLPTEAEWEYAARGGGKSRGYKYSGSNNPDEVAWYHSNEPHPIGTKRSNELGIYDLSGNVDEWCQDWYNYYGNSPQNIPTGYCGETFRVCRGGSYYDFSATYCRVSRRGANSPDFGNEYLGFRLVLVP